MDYQILSEQKNGLKTMAVQVRLRNKGEYRRAVLVMPQNTDTAGLNTAVLEAAWLDSQPDFEGAAAWAQFASRQQQPLYDEVWQAFMRQLDAAEVPELAYLISAGVAILAKNPELLARYNKLVNALRSAPAGQQQDFAALLMLLLAGKS